MIRFNKRFWKRAAVLLLITTALIRGIAAFPYERLLLRQATRICRTSDWSADDDAYHWLSNDVLLYETSAGAQVRLWQLNVRTRRIEKNTPLLAMQDAYPIDSFSLSPDRQWALWDTRRLGHLLHVAARVDGSVVHTWKAQPMRVSVYSAWLGQEHRCIEFIKAIDGTFDQALVRSAENLPFATRYSIAEHGAFNDTGLSNYGSTTVSNGHVLRYNGERDEATGKWRLVDIDLTRTPWRDQTYWLTLPADADVYAFYFHPRQKRLAILVAYPTTVAWSVLVHRFLNRVPIRTEWQLGLWVAEWTGEHLHEIGHVPISNPDKFTSPITQVAWLPDDKNLSFIYRNSLYRVSSEP